MIEVETKQWGNSLGIIIPKKIVEELKIEAKDKIIIDIKKENPLEKLFNWKEGKKITRKAFLKNRKEMESKWI